MKSPNFITAVIIYPDGSAIQADIHRPAELKTLQGLVGGYIDAAPTAGNVSIYINDEGAINGLPQNRVATTLWGLLNPEAPRQYLHGVAVVTGGPNNNGDNTDIPANIAEAILNMSREIKPGQANR